MTKEDWAKLEDYEMESVPAVTFTTPSGKDVEFVKVVRCKDCKYYEAEGNYCERDIVKSLLATEPTDFCSWAARRESDA